jgi:hypothetical protein
MHRWLLILTLALYGFTALDLHEWVRVPEVVLHLLEHHSDLGHHHDAPAQHDHEDSGHHDPFGHAHHEACGAGSLVSLPGEASTPALIISASARALLPAEAPMALSAFSGSKWNPPKLG